MRRTVLKTNQKQRVEWQASFDGLDSDEGRIASEITSVLVSARRSELVTRATAQD